MSDMITTTGRSINTITAEILTITTQTNQMVVLNAIEVGRRLVEAKALVEHGEWGDYLAKEVKFSQSTANNLMKIFREYGDKPNSQALGNLPYTKMVRLLAVPEDEREEFVQAHDVEHLSTRELEQAIKERNAAQELLAVAQGEANASQQKAADLQSQVDKLTADLNKATAAADKAKKQAQKLKDHSQLPAGELERLTDEAKASAQQEYAARLESAEQAKAAAEKALREVQAQLAEAQKASKLADPEVAAFNAAFQQVQAQFNQMMGHFIKIENKDPAQAEGLRKALTALLESWMGRVRKESMP